MSFDEYSFADLLSNIVDNRGKTCPVEDEGFPLIATNCIKDDSLYPVFEKVRFVSDDTYKNWFRGHPNAGDIIFVCKGSPGRVAWVKEPVSFCIAQDMVAIRADQRVVDPMFLFSLLRSEQVINKINNMHVGTLIPHFKKGDFKNLYLSIPRDLKLQKAIGLFYFSLSEKIEKNKEINQTLEQMAQALFKSWFVDFEPVKAKMTELEAGGSQEDATLAAMTAISGKDADALAVFEREYPEQYAELKTTAELFPSAMQESELGEIPEGWYVSDLSEVASLNAESWSKKNAPESVSYVDLANTKWGVINSIETYQFSDAPSRARRILKLHDTIVGTVRPGNGSYSYINKTGLTGSTGFAVLTPKARIFSEYIYLCVTSNESIERLAHLADGGAYPAVNADVVLSTQCVLPVERDTREAVLKVFSSRTDMFFSYRANGLSQNEILSNIRDTLLPKLLSGEITLPEAEQAVSEAENV
ncbi:restriction endonuclease subunit S [Yokenella regensburgei]|uniref:restriction endonuclease subunit S n=1 Tax=Yokenella regensburgei TaxID=158877 RepID=UPI0020773201|nr:restriction endonuclease subunit S [Yokenella regensburgei]